MTDDIRSPVRAGFAPIVLSEHARETVDRFAARHRRTDTPQAMLALGSDLESTARKLCDEARVQDARRAERLILSLRETWPTLPAVRETPPGADRARLLERLVSACIAAFYTQRTN